MELTHEQRPSGRKPRAKATCHPDRPHVARGLCRKCYGRAQYKGALDNNDKVRVQKQATCHPDRAHTAHGLCAECYAAKYRSDSLPTGERRRATCHPDRPYRSKGLCNACFCRAKYAANPQPYRDRAKKYTFEKLYNLTPDGFAELLASQGGKCANRGCQVLLNTRGREKMAGAHVDHCHTTGKVRGVLCMACNLALGMVKECPSRLSGLASYISTRKRAA